MYIVKLNMTKCLIFCVLFLLLGCESGLTEAEYLARASASLEQGERKAAVISIKNALKLNAGNYQAHAMLGNVMLDSDSPALAEIEFEKLRQLGAGSKLWSAGLTKAYLLQGKLDDVVGVDASQLEGKVKVDVLAYAIMARVQQKRFGLASALIEQAEKLSINSIELELAKIRFFASSGKFDDARKAIERVLAVEPNQYDALLLLGDIELHDKSYEAAENAYAKAYKGLPERAQALLQLAHVQLGRKDIENAQQSINALLKRYPENLKVNLLQGKLFIEQGKRIKALPFIEKAANSNYSPMDAYFYAAMLHLENDRLEQADQFARQLLGKAPKSFLATLLKANIRLKQKSFKEAEALSYSVVQVQPENVSALNILASSKLQQGDVKGALPNFSKVVSLQPKDISARLRLAKAFILAKQFAKADEQVKRVLLLDTKNLSAIVLNVRSAIAQGHNENALMLIANLKKEEPDKAFPYLLEADLYRSMSQLSLLKGSLQAACEVEPRETHGCLAYADNLTKEKAYSEALTTYESILSNEPKHLNATLGKAKVYALQEKFSEMEAWLQQTVASFPEAIQPKLILGQYYLSRGQGDKANLLFGTTDKKLVSDPAFLQMLASAQLETKQFKRANLTVKKLLEIQPDNKQTQVLNALVQSSLGNAVEAEKKLKTLLKAEPNNPVLKVSVAKVLYKQKKYAEAEQLLNTLSKEQAEQESVLPLRSTLALSQNHFKRATALAKMAFDKNKSSGNLLLLAQQTWREGKKNGALSLMTDWLSNNNTDLRVRSELAALYTQIGEQAKADKENQAILAQDENNIIALNNLAWSYKDSSPVKALELATKLNDLQPGVPAFLDTLAMVELKNGHVDLASRYMEQAMAKQSAPVFVYHKAMIDAKKGDWLSAIKDLTGLLEKGDGFAERKEAENFLSKLKAGE